MNHRLCRKRQSLAQQSKKRRIFRESLPGDVQTLGQVDYEAQPEKK